MIERQPIKLQSLKTGRFFLIGPTLVRMAIAKLYRASERECQTVRDLISAGF